ncbi:hypothetical protein [Catenovulum agarivorans]|uniref:hypothetical protein n=1 Tax=Catenovulum agarivorans TaxID=1172192 RepID=UPI00030ED09D|nr:hypothetical protein [Catenovulum agarivorans]
MLTSGRTYKIIRLITWSVGIVSLIIFYLWFEYLRPSNLTPTSQHLSESAFNPFVWAKGKGDYSSANPRQALYLDVLRNHLANGMDVTAVEKKLGLPDSFDKQKQYNYLLSYDINSGIYQYLIVQFDSNQKVLMYYRFEVNHVLN